MKILSRVTMAAVNLTVCYIYIIEQVKLTLSVSWWQLEGSLIMDLTLMCL